MTEKMGNAYIPMVLFIAGFGMVFYGSTHEEYSVWGMGFVILCLAFSIPIEKLKREEAKDKSKTWLTACYGINIYFASMIILATAYFVVGELYSESEKTIVSVGVMMMTLGYVPYFFISVGFIIISKIQRWYKKNEEWVCGGKIE